MIIITISELSIGAVFCFDLKLKNRESFTVTSSDNDAITFVSKNTGKQFKLKKIENKMCYLLNR